MNFHGFRKFLIYGNSSYPYVVLCIYGRDPRVPTSLDFYQPVSSLPVLETDYARELFAETKRARQLAKQNIERAQTAQKKQYDKHSRCSTLSEGDLVMLKVEPRFKLDRSYRGPYRVQGVTPTNVFIRPVNDPNGEVLDVSIQRVSKCSEMLSSAVPWMGHTNKRRRRCRIKKSLHINPMEDVTVAAGNSVSPMNSEDSVTTQVKQTRHGRQIRQPIRFRDQDCLMASPTNRGKL